MKTNIISIFSKENFYTFLLLKRKLTMNLKNYYLIAVWIFKLTLIINDNLFDCSKNYLKKVAVNIILHLF
jgi:hypothetical protein